jgi:hypothetical protein
LWTITKDGKSGIYDDLKGWVMPAECDEVQAISVFYSVDSNVVGLLYYSIHGKYGAKTTNGQEILPCIYDEVMQDGSEMYIFRNGDSLMALTLNTYSSMSNLAAQSFGSNARTRYQSSWSMNKQVPADGIFPSFEGKENVTAWYYPGSTHRKVYYDGEYYVVDRGMYYNFTVPDTIVLACTFFTRPLDAPVTQNNSLQVYHYDGLERRGTTGSTPDFVFVPGNRYKLSPISETIIPVEKDTFYVSGNHDLFSQTGRLIFSGDSVFDINQYEQGTTGEPYFSFYGTKGWCAADTNGRILAGPSRDDIGEFSSQYAWVQNNEPTYNYRLINNKTKTRVLTKKEDSDEAYPIWDSITLLENNKSGTCIYNLNTHRYVVKGLNNIVALDEHGQSFLVKTCLGHMGVITCDGKWLVDTLYDVVTPSGIVKRFTANDFSGYSYSLMLYARYWIFSTPTTQVVYNTQTRQVLPMSNYTNQFWKDVNYEVPGNSVQQFMLDTSIMLTKNLCVFFTAKGDTAAYQPWMKQCIVDSLFAIERLYDYRTFSENDWYVEQYGYYDCRYCMDRKSPHHPYRWIRDYSMWGRFRMTYLSDSAISFCRSYQTSGNNGDYLRDSWFSNVMLFPDGPRNMTFDSLFNPATDWRNYIINAVLSYVNSHDEIEGDCHNPAGIPMSLQTQFMFGKDGIIIYPPEFEEENQQLTITLPWKDVASYLRTDVKSKLPLTTF